MTRRTVDVFFLLLIIAAGGYAALTYRDAVGQIGRQIEARFLPCRSPITYSIGRIDPRFHIATSTLIADLKEAEALWEKSSDKDLFAYETSGGDIEVGLIYDYRQQATDKMAGSGIQIDKSMSSYNALKAQYDTLSAHIASGKAALKASAAAYSARQMAYNAEVAKWNRQGGAPPAAYDRLQQEKAALNADAQRLKAMEAQVNADIDTENAMGTSLNKLIAELNLNVEKYNQAGASVGGEFEEGEYVSEAGMQRIDIYEYSSHNELVRVLAHELGHALGLGHVEDAQAIMYKVNQGKALTLTQADIAALNAQCTSGIF